jgi:hypothetical protein
MQRAKKKSLRRQKPPERLSKVVCCSRLANAGPEEPAVVFNADAATGQKIGYCCNCLLRVLGAGTNCQDQVTEREFGAWLEDLFGVFHDQSH